MRTFVMGDVHGAHKAMVQCFQRSGFDKENDTLIQLGDVVDGWSDVYECVDELLSIKNLIPIKGNHDDWFNEFLMYQVHPVNFMQGGDGTRNSYNKHLGIFNVPQEHHLFFAKQHLHYVDDQNRCFVHGGFNRHEPFKGQAKHIYYWDRDLWYSAMSFAATKKGDKEIKFKTKEDFKEIYIGHTTTVNWDVDKPIQAGQVWNLDTGAGYKGKLTIMDIDTKEIFQSDEVSGLYNGERGRN